jgi:hypothetical protein
MADKSGATPAQIAASTIAAVGAAYVGSRFGITGTAMGAGVGSIITMGGTSLTQRSLERTHRTLAARLSAQRKVGLAEAPTERLRVEDLVQARAAKERLPRRKLTWKWAAIGSVVVFALAMGVVFLMEAGTGHPISGGNEGTTLTGLFGAATSHPQPPTVTHTLVVPTSTATAPTTSLPTTQPTTTTPQASSDSLAPSLPLLPEETTPTATTTVAPPPSVLVPLTPGVTP